jgi:hypothetical protein
MAAGKTNIPANEAKKGLAGRKFGGTLTGLWMS